MEKTKFKKGDSVLVIAGKDRGKSGKIASVDAKSGKAIVEGLNIYKKHAKPSNKYPQGGIMDIAKAIKLSNLMIVCSSCKKAARVSVKKTENSYSRVCKKCNEVINVA